MIDLKRTGIDDKVTEAGDQLAGVIGKRNVDKLGDIVMTSFGYSESETCLCCPCLPASQVKQLYSTFYLYERFYDTKVLLLITVPFFIFNFYKLGLGVEYDVGCSSNFTNSKR